jgi:superfamily I DNA/RNA helicase
MARLRALLQEVPWNEAPAAVVAHVFDAARWVDPNSEDAVLARDDIARLAAECERILEEHPQFSLKQVGTQLRYRIGTREPIGAPAPAGIRIVTLWGAKGLTADYVYLAGLFDEALPGPHDPESTGLDEAEHLDEQRRLLYVSLTRAREALVISRLRRIRTGEVRRLGLLSTSHFPSYWRSLRPCRFFANVSPQSLPNAVAGTTWAGINLD